MKSPTRVAVTALLQEAHDAGSCFVSQNPTQHRLLNHAVEDGVAIRIAPGVYTSKELWGSIAPSAQALYKARALAKQHPSWVFAGVTAALAHGLWVGNRRCGEIWRLGRKSSRSRVPGQVQLIKASNDVQVVRCGVPVTSFLRTVYDCLRLLPFPEALAIADSALRNTGISRDGLANSIKRACVRKPGVQHVLDIISLADGRSENGGESMARAQMISLGFAIPELQLEVKDPIDSSRTYRLDFAWELPDQTLIVGELDGREKYVNEEMTQGRGPTNTILAERRRESRLTIRRQRVRVMRFSFAESQNRYYFERLLMSYDVPRSEGVPEVARLRVA